MNVQGTCVIVVSDNSIWVTRTADIPIIPAFTSINEQFSIGIGASLMCFFLDMIARSGVTTACPVIRINVTCIVIVVSEMMVRKRCVVQMPLNVV